MLPKAHLTSYSRMSGSRSVTTPSLLSKSLRPFLYSYSVYSCHLFLISSASVKSLPFLFYSAHLCMKWSLGISNFLEEIAIFPILLFSSISFLLNIVYLRRPFSLILLFFGTLHSDGYIFPFLLCLLLLFSAICKASKDKHFALLHFFFPWGWFWSQPLSIVLQALYQI